MIDRHVGSNHNPSKSFVRAATVDVELNSFGEVSVVANDVDESSEDACGTRCSICQGGGKLPGGTPC